MDASEVGREGDRIDADQNRRGVIVVPEGAHADPGLPQLHQERQDIHLR
ncbi:hypothetical protein ABZ766_13605 [Streptomyces sp. NPDC006670]